MRYSIVQAGSGRAFPEGDLFLSGATAIDGAEIVVYCGAALVNDTTRTAILVELGSECLGVHTGEEAGGEGSNVLGFARYRNGADAPSDLIELVRQPATSDAALDAARDLLKAAGFKVAVCGDHAGRIVDRLVRPKYNAALRFLDEGLASRADIDATCRLGLGYPDGPIERVVRGGLADHYDITRGLFEASGQPGYAPARRAGVAHARKVR